jgi:hypothetical protein
LLHAHPGVVADLGEPKTTEAVVVHWMRGLPLQVVAVCLVWLVVVLKLEAVVPQWAWLVVPC